MYKIHFLFRESFKKPAKFLYPLLPKKSLYRGSRALKRVREDFQGTVGPHPGMQLFGEGGFIFVACQFFVKPNKKLTRIGKS
jgi:hypothetical protein